MVTNSKGNISARFVGMVFLTCFGKDEGISGNLNGMGGLLEEVMGCWDLVRDHSHHSVRSQGVTASVDLEWSQPCQCIGSIIASEFSCSELEVPIILVITRESTKNVLQCSVGMFSLAIGLGMECSGHGKFGTQGLEQ